MGLQIHLLQLLSMLAFWIALHEGAYLLLGILHRRSLVCWSIGPLGTTTTYLQKPGQGFLLLQLLAPAILAALFLRFCLFETMPPPIASLPDGTLAQALTMGFSVLCTSTFRALMLVRDWRYPLWGEARVLRSVSWLRATGAFIYFTAFGQAFLRERFEATPHEFLRAL